MSVGWSNFTLEQFSEFDLDDYSNFLLEGVIGGGPLTLRCEAASVFCPGISAQSVHVVGVANAAVFILGVAAEKVDQ